MFNVIHFICKTNKNVAPFKWNSCVTAPIARPSETPLC
jgi:hypothetical protein